MFKFIVISMLTAILALTTISAQAAGELYIDLGVAYVHSLEITEKAHVTFGDYTISAEASAELSVEGALPFARIGYLFNNWGIEVEGTGTPELSLNMARVYYRFTFK